jgi:hypothetical protein
LRKAHQARRQSPNRSFEEYRQLSCDHWTIELASFHFQAADNNPRLPGISVARGTPDRDPASCFRDFEPNLCENVTNLWPVDLIDPQLAELWKGGVDFECL